MRESNTAFLSIATADDMCELGQRLGAAIDGAEGPLVVTLRGELGAGKTTLVRGVLRALAIEGAIRSPTYTLIEPYESRGRSLYHLDLYRVTDPSEVEHLGIRDFMEKDALLLIEWPENGGSALPRADLSVRINYVGTGDAAREVALVAATPSGISVLTRLDSVKPQQRRLSP
jgi:tRNA threonylcarbamoyladenosine biosynthesis protein TsaE